MDLGFFYDDLAPYGNWIERPSYGWVWTPRGCRSSWRPYRGGHWVWTDEGWTWISDEPYGWATYHYGRWYDDPEIGWSWVPGDEWAPSWVSFQEGGDYVGWAPLPPGVNVSVSFGSGYGGYAYGIAPEDYLFVPERNFLAPRISAYYVSQDRIGPLYRRTRNFTNYRFNGGRVFNQGVPVERFQRYGKVRRYQVADVGANYRTARRALPGGSRRILPSAGAEGGPHRSADPAAGRPAGGGERGPVQGRPSEPRGAARQERSGPGSEVRGQAPVFRQHQKAAAVQQRQARVDQRQVRVDKRQTRVDRQQVRVDRSRSGRPGRLRSPPASEGGPATAGPGRPAPGPGEASPRRSPAGPRRPVSAAAGPAGSERPPAPEGRSPAAAGPGGPAPGPGRPPAAASTASRPSVDRSQQRQARAERQQRPAHRQDDRGRWPRGRRGHGKPPGQ